MIRQRIIKIDSDGTPNHTVISTEDGRELEGVLTANWRLNCSDGIAFVDLEMRGQAVHTQGQLVTVEFICQVCGHREDHRCDQSDDLP